MKSIIVLSTVEQFSVFQGMARDSELLVFCDNEALFTLLRENGVDFCKLNESLIRDQWEAINSWGCGQASGWIKACHHLTPVDLPDILPGLYLNFSRMLISAAKNHAFAMYLIEIIRPSKVYVFSKAYEPAFPDYSGNAFLNYFLKSLSIQKNISCQTLGVFLPKRSWRENLCDVHRTVRHYFKNLVALFFLRVPKAGCKKYFLVFGSLRHLKAVTSALYQRKIPILVFDHEFHSEIAFYAFKKKIPYLTADRMIEPSPEMLELKKELFVEQLKAKFLVAQKQGFFKTENCDFSELLQEMVLSTMGKYLKKLAGECFCYAELVKKTTPLGCLVDEDTALRANFCAFMNHSKVGVFCVSHAHTAFDFDVDAKHRAFSQSITFVNSEHEKIKMYGARGWDLSGIIVSGTPRYDRYPFIRRLLRSSGSRKQILFCAGSMSYLDDNMLSYLACDVYAYKHFQEMAFAALVEASEGLPVTIMAKSPYVSDERGWERYIKSVKKMNYTTPIKLFKHSIDFAGLLAQSDAMVLSYWSTSLIEAALCEIPTIYLDLDSQKSPAVLEFSSQGLCRYACNVAQLRLELEKIVAGCAVIESAMDKPEFYLGKPPGNNAEIVAGIISKALKNEANENII